MPRGGHQRTEHQKAHAVAMQKRWWLPKTPVKAQVINPVNRRLLSRERQKHKEELEKVQRLESNGQRREQRLKEKLEKVELESQAWVEEALEAAEEHHKEKLQEVKKGEESLKNNLARLNARNRREPSRIQHTVQRALRHSGNPNPALPIVRYIKDRQGIVQDWTRNAIVTLVNEGVPISKTWPVTKANAAALDVTIVGKWSTRTSGRAVREGGVAAGLMIIEYVLTCICS